VDLGGCGQVNETVEMLAEPAEETIPGTKKRPAGEAPNEADKRVKGGKQNSWVLF
jgi:hypothetical protein